MSAEPAASIKNTHILSWDLWLCWLVYFGKLSIAYFYNNFAGLSKALICAHSAAPRLLARDKFPRILVQAYYVPPGNFDDIIHVDIMPPDTTCTGLD
jgi:hypothetical protein